MMDKNHKEHIKKVAETLNKMTIKYCDEYLDDDYKKLCAKLIDRMSRKRNVPFLSGRIEIWAAAIVYAIGSINFLFDKSFDPYVRGEDICNYFGTSNSTTAQKAKVIRDMFKLQYYHPEFSTKRMSENNPIADMVMINGLMFDKKTLPKDIREYVEKELKRKKK
jgi:hypothetical protein